MEPSLSTIIKKTTYAITSAVLVNVVFIFIVKFFIHPPSTFSPFFYSLIALYTVLGVAAAGVVYIILKRFFSNYNKIFTSVSVVALILSLIPDIGLYISPGPDDIGITIPIVIVLILTHIFAACIAVRKLTAKE